MERETGGHRKLDLPKPLIQVVLSAQSPTAQLSRRVGTTRRTRDENEVATGHTSRSRDGRERLGRVIKSAAERRWNAVRETGLAADPEDEPQFKSVHAGARVTTKKEA